MKLIPKFYRGTVILPIEDWVYPSLQAGYQMLGTFMRWAALHPDIKEFGKNTKGRMWLNNSAQVLQFEFTDESDAVQFKLTFQNND